MCHAPVSVKPLVQPGTSGFVSFHLACAGVMGNLVSNRAAIILASVIILALILDRVLNAGNATMFILRKLFDLVEYLAFWR
jgi:hypothetical protein